MTVIIQQCFKFQVVEPASKPDDNAPGGQGIAIPATIAEEPSNEESAGSVGSEKHPNLGPPKVQITDNTTINKVVTSAEVLPRKLSFRGIDEDDLTRLEQELFNNPHTPKGDHPFSRSFRSDKSDTDTVINELFGEELEKMDRERLADRYDVLDLKDLETYDPSPWILRDSNSKSGATMRRRRSKSPPAGSLHSLWDYDEDNDFDNSRTAAILSTNTSTTVNHPPSSTTTTTVAGRAKYL